MVGLKTYIWAFGDGNIHDGAYFTDPVTKIAVQFVLNADYAPFAMRKSAWRWGCDCEHYFRGMS